MGDGRWAMGDGRWAVGGGRWAMGGGPRKQRGIMRRIQVMVLGGLLLGAASARAQDPQTAMIMTTVHKVFDAMRTRDTVLLASAFDTTAKLVGAPRNNG